MSVFIDDLAWIAIGLAVVTVFFVISVALIFLDEGLRILFRKASHWLAGLSAATPPTPARLSAGPKPQKTTGRIHGGAAFPVLATAWHKLQKRLHANAGGNHLPFRWGHR